MTTENSHRRIKLAKGRTNSIVALPDPILQKLNKTFDRIDKRFDNLEIGLADLHEEMMDGFDRLILRLDELNDRMERFLHKYAVRSADTSLDPITRPD
ncbi:MAG TPA: hypothetical protein VGA27_13265 [Candidatus Binatia bacterium]